MHTTRPPSPSLLKQRSENLPERISLENHTVCFSESQVKLAASNTSNFSFHFVKDRSVLVFSAYLDTRDGVLVRFVGAAVARLQHKDLYCHVWDPESDEMKTVNAKVQLLVFGFNIKYETAFILCSLTKVPSARTRVSLTLGACSVPSFFKTLLRLPAQPVPKHPLGLEMCVGPLYNNYNNDSYLIEFVEFNRLLGYRHFTFYNYSVGPRFSRVLSSYEREGLVTVIPWWRNPFPTGNRWPQPNNLPYLIHYFGQIMTLQDCLYRSIWRAENRFVSFQDIDEVMVPHGELPHPKTLSEFVAKALDPNKTVASLSIANSFFSLNIPDDPNKFKLVLLRKLQRELAIFKHTDRSKVIVDAFRTVFVMVHWVGALMKGFTGQNVPGHQVLLHHYRNWKSSGRRVRDPTLLRYAPMLVRAVSKRQKQLGL